MIVEFLIKNIIRIKDRLFLTNDRILFAKNREFFVNDRFVSANDRILSVNNRWLSVNSVYFQLWSFTFSWSYTLYDRRLNMIVYLTWSYRFSLRNKTKWLYASNRALIKTWATRAPWTITRTSSDILKIARYLRIRRKSGNEYRGNFQAANFWCRSRGIW